MHMRSGHPQRGALARAVSRTVIQGLRADAARRQIHDALERGIVRAARDQPQICERILDFRALEEPQAAVHPVRHARIQKRLFEHARLRVRAVQHRDFAARAAALDPVADAVHDEIRLVALVERGVQLDPLAVLAAGPQILAEAAGVVRDERVGGFEDRAGRAVILLELVRAAPADSRGGTGADSRRARRASDRSD